MKSLVIGVSIILLALFLPGFSILAGPAYAPHENPAVADSSIDIAALLLAYGGIFDLAALSQFQNAGDFLDKLEEADIPDDLRYILARYNALIRQLFTHMDNLGHL